MNNRLPRRTFLQLMLAWLASACSGSKDPLSQADRPLPPKSSPTLAPTPVSTSTPHPFADSTASAFLSAWSTGNYDTMYDLLTNTTRLTWSRDQFRARYVNVLDEATVTTVQIELLSLLHDGPRAQVGFRVRWQTILFGSLEFDNTMNLLWEGERWGVAWSSTLVLPQLGDDLGLVLLNQEPVRGHIYDRNGVGLAVNGQGVTIGIIPGRIQEETNTVARLSTIADLAPDVIRSKIAAARPDWFLPIAKVSPEVSINDDDVLSSLAGVTRRVHPVRLYKEGDLAAHLVGYVGTIPPDDLAEWQLRGYRGDELIGRAGVEAWGEFYLAGRRGGRLVTLNRQNEEVAQVAQVEAQTGRSIYFEFRKKLRRSASCTKPPLGRRCGYYDKTNEPTIQYPRAI